MKKVLNGLKLGTAVTALAAAGLLLCAPVKETKTANAQALATVENVTSFEMYKGASVRVSATAEDTGMAFKATISKAEYEALGETAKFGFVIAPDFYACDDAHDLTAENVFGDDAIYYVDDNVIDGTQKDGKYEIWNVDTPKITVVGETVEIFGSVANFANDNEGLVRDYVARAYVQKDGAYSMAGYFEDSRANNTRSMAIVAQTALAVNDANVTDKVTFKATYVTPVTYDKAVYIDDTSAFPVEEIFGSEATMSAAIAFGEDQITVESSIVKGLPVTATETEHTLFVKSSAGKKFVNVIPVTKAIRTVEDMDALKVTSGTDINFGYFVLCNDIDYKGASYAHYSGLGNDLGCGFYGVFDGKGHTISNIELNYGGLFGRLYGTTSGEDREIKNVAFKNVTFPANTSDCSVIAVGNYNAEGGTQNAACTYAMKNMYIQVTKLPTYGPFGIITRDAINVHSKMENVVIDTGDLTMSAEQCGILCAYGITNSSGMNNANKNVKNVVVLSKMYLGYRVGDKNYLMDANNKSTLAEGTVWQDRADSDGDGVYEQIRLCKFTGVVRYESAAECIAANNDFSDFDGAYWDISSGAPAWKVNG